MFVCVRQSMKEEQIKMQFILGKEEKIHGEMELHWLFCYPSFISLKERWYQMATLNNRLFKRHKIDF